MPHVSSAPGPRAVDSASFRLPAARRSGPQAGKRRPPHGRSANGTGRNHGPLRRLWLGYKALYYASTPAWQVLKSGALFILGIFCWSTGNLLLSYEPSWSWTYYLMAYGFLLIPWGPVTHLALVPHVTPFLRRRFRSVAVRFAARHLSLVNFGIFVVHVVMFGLFPPSHLTFEFDATPTETTAAAVDPALTCLTAPAPHTVSCRLEASVGVSSVQVESAGEQLLILQESPFEFQLHRDRVHQIVGRREFEVHVLTEDGELIRSYTRAFGAMY